MNKNKEFVSFKDYVVENGMFVFSKTQKVDKVLAKLNAYDIHSILNNPNKSFTIYDGESDLYYTFGQRFYGDIVNYTIDLLNVSVYPGETRNIIYKGVESMPVKSRFEWFDMAYA